MITPYQQWAADLEAHTQDLGIELEGTEEDWQRWFERGLSVDDVVRRFRKWTREEIEEAEGYHRRKWQQENS